MGNNYKTRPTKKIYTDPPKDLTKVPIIDIHSRAWIENQPARAMNALNNLCKNRERHAWVRSITLNGKVKGGHFGQPQFFMTDVSSFWCDDCGAHHNEFAEEDHKITAQEYYFFIDPKLESYAGTDPATCAGWVYAPSNLDTALVHTNWDKDAFQRSRS